MPCNRRAVLADLTRFWSMTVDQVARRAVGAESTAANRLAQLVNAGTQHRAESGLSLKRVGRSPGDLDYLFFYFDQR